MVDVTNIHTTPQFTAVLYTEPKAKLPKYMEKIAMFQLPAGIHEGKGTGNCA